jgi:hypothetical protein
MDGNINTRLFFVIGDTAYLHKSKMITPYKGTLTEEEKVYNHMIASRRMKVECTFGRLKWRFRRFRYPSKNGDGRTFSEVFIFACAIRNIIKLNELDACDDFINEFINDNEALLYDLSDEDNN